LFLVIYCLIVYGFMKAISGNYIINSPFNSAFITIFVAIVTYLLTRAIKFVWMLNKLNKSNMTDSIGNELPDGKLLLSRNTGDESLTKALALNTFLLACKISMQNGQTVIYDKDRRLATITDSNGITSIVNY
jgi:hypothetical protein